MTHDEEHHRAALIVLGSMIGYKNDRYLYFVRTVARLDDIANFLPADMSQQFNLDCRRCS